MSYKIAIGSSNGIDVDLKFGEVEKFLIYEIDGEAKLVEERNVIKEADDTKSVSIQCGDRSGCGGRGSGCGGHGNGCGGEAEVISKVTLIEDCRCVVCKKIGFQAQKQFEKKAISVFDVECTTKEALEKISFYYNKIDNHESFRKS